MAEQAPQVVLPTPVGEVRLIKSAKHRRFAEFRRKGKFAWTLGRDNALTRAIDDRLRTDLAGSIALNLFDRASITWFMAPDVAISHDPDNVERVEETPALFEAAQAIADALRAEINEDVVVEEAVDRIDGELLHRTPSAIQLGRATKAAADHPDHCFGRLAPLGVTSVAVVAPWLGYVPALGLTDWFHWGITDLPWYSAGPQIDVEDLDTEVWVRPMYRAVDSAVEMAAVTSEVLAATEAPESSPSLRFTCDRVDVCEPLGIALAANLQLATAEGPVATVDRILPLHVSGFSWKSFDEATPGIEAARSAEAPLLLCPFGERDALRYFADSKELIHHFMWMARDRIHVPVDPWEYGAVPPNHVPAHETREITYFEFDDVGYRSALAEIFLSSRGGNVRESAVRAVAEALREVRESLSEAGEAIASARSLGISDRALDQLAKSVETAREALGDEVSWPDLLDSEVEEEQAPGGGAED